MIRRYFSNVLTSTLVISARHKGGNGTKLDQMFRLDIRKRFFTEKGVTGTGSLGKMVTATSLPGFFRGI